MKDLLKIARFIHITQTLTLNIDWCNILKYMFQFVKTFLPLVSFVSNCILLQKPDGQENHFLYKYIHKQTYAFLLGLSAMQIFLTKLIEISYAMFYINLHLNSFKRRRVGNAANLLHTYPVLHTEVGISFALQIEYPITQTITLYCSMTM